MIPEILSAVKPCIWWREIWNAEDKNYHRPKRDRMKQIKTCNICASMRILTFMIIIKDQCPNVAKSARSALRFGFACDNCILQRQRGGAEPIPYSAVLTGPIQLSRKMQRLRKLASCTHESRRHSNIWYAYIGCLTFVE
jgi:hypothetical protein